MTNRPREMLYPNEYVWLVLVSCLDIMLTWVILKLGGFEVNAVADAVITRFGLVGMVMFKLSLVVVFILICETVGRRRLDTGRLLSRAAIAITIFPVFLALALIHQ